MNERIRELAQRATETHTSYFDGRGNVTETFFDKEKFAELIVRECAELCDINDREQGDILREHFGVEEQEKVVLKPKCSVCGTTENVKYMGGHQPYLCDSEDCIPF